MPQSLPIVYSLAELIPTLKVWQQSLNLPLRLPQLPRIPFNFRATSGPAGTLIITLRWERVVGSDGYQLQSSMNGDFSSVNVAPILATIRGSEAIIWVDSPGISTKRWYRIRATAGTASQPQSVLSPWSAPIIQISGSGNVVYDQVSSTAGVNGWNNLKFPAIGPKPTDPF